MTARQLLQLLQRTGETQVGMARKLGISDRNMRRYVAGSLQVPRVMEIAIHCLVEHSRPDPRSPRSSGTGRCVDRSNSE